MRDARGTTDANPAFRFVAIAMVIVLTTNSLTSGMDFLRDASRMSGVASIPEKNGLSLLHFLVYPEVVSSQNILQREKKEKEEEDDESKYISSITRCKRVSNERNK